MTLQNRATLKTKFETGDIPTQQDFFDLIESLFNKIDDSNVTVPPLTGNAGKVLTTNGVSTSWTAGTNHERLSGLLGGATNEHYHLTQLDYSEKITNRKWGTGVDYSQFDADGTLRMFGAATVWQDLLPTAVYTPTGASSPNITVYAGSTTLLCQEFTNNGGAEEYNPSYQMPHQWVEGSIIRPHCHLAVPNDGNGGTITMHMTYQWVNVNETGIVNETTISGSIVRLANAGVGHNMILSFGDIDGTGKLISSIITARVTRDTNDSFQSSVWLKSADIHVECNSIGSGLPLVK